MYSSAGNVRYKEAACVMWLLNYVHCRSKHTKNFSINSEMLMPLVWQLVTLEQLKWVAFPSPKVNVKKVRIVDVRVCFTNSSSKT
jgi:hypothetical protein